MAIIKLKLSLLSFSVARYARVVVITSQTCGGDILHHIQKDEHKGQNDPDSSF